MTSPKLTKNFFNPSQQCYQNFVYFVQTDKQNVTFNFFISILSYRLLNSQGSLLKQIFRTIYKVNFGIRGIPGNLGGRNL